MKSLFFAFLFFILSPPPFATTTASVLDVCPQELGLLSACLAQSAALDSVVECIDCVGDNLGELQIVTSCETFNGWYCGSLEACGPSCGPGCGRDFLDLAVCILTTGGQNPPQDDCSVDCLEDTVITSSPEVQDPGAPTESPALPPTQPPGGPAITPCSQEGADRCGETFKVCYSTDGKETCGNCLNRYVEFPPGDEDPPCILIEDLPWKEFYEYMEENDPPIYLDDLSSEERLKLLYIVLRIISAENSRFPPPPFKMGINKFSADTLRERKKLSGFVYNEAALDELGGQFGRFPAPTDRELQALPAEKDWVKDGAVTTIKDQGRCGCCWAESVIGAVEGAAAITPENAGFLQSLSTQQLISCDVNNYGCDGGNILYGTGFSWKTDGIYSKDDWPFTDEEGTTTKQCLKPDKERSVFIDNPVIVTTYSDVLTREERLQKMKAAVARQPVSVALKTDCATFTNYQSGIMTQDGACACEAVGCIDHAVLLVGYSDVSDPPYWLLKNTWGTGWGEDGYFRISQLGGGDLGLFGLLGEGVVPLEAYNKTAQVGSSDLSSAAAGHHHPMTLWPFFIIPCMTMIVYIIG